MTLLSDVEFESPHPSYNIHDVCKWEYAWEKRAPVSTNWVGE